MIVYRVFFHSILHIKWDLHGKTTGANKARKSSIILDFISKHEGSLDTLVWKLCYSVYCNT